MLSELQREFIGMVKQVKLEHKAALIRLAKVKAYQNIGLNKALGKDISQDREFIRQLKRLQ